MDLVGVGLVGSVDFHFVGSGFAGFVGLDLKVDFHFVGLKVVVVVVHLVVVVGFVEVAVSLVVDVHHQSLMVLHYYLANDFVNYFVYYYYYYYYLIFLHQLVHHHLVHHLQYLLQI